MAKTLVTGGTGLVGRHLREILPNAYYLSSKECDLRSETDVKKVFGSNWDRIVHLAARVGGILDNIRHPSDLIEDNLLINANLVRGARENGVERFTAILSTCIYPDVAENYPMTEEAIHSGPPQRTNFSYAIAKRALAVQIDAANEQFGLKYNYLIPCNLYGEYDHFDEERSHYVTTLLGKIVEATHEGSDTIYLLGSGRPLRQFMYAGDLAKVVKLCIDNDVTGSFNVANEENLSIRQIAEMALVATGHGELGLEFDNSSPDGQFRKDVSNARFREFFPDFEFMPLSEGLKRVYKFLHERANI